MASTFKSFLNSDITTTRTLLHEVVPMTGSIVARTYVSSGVETNIKTYGHGMLQSVYDYPYLSSSANHIFDISVGVHPDWEAGAPGAAITVGKATKNNIYAQMAQMLVGFDENGNVRKFDKDGNFSDTTTDKYTNCAFLSFSRLLVKDEIKKGSFEIHLGVRNGPAQNFTLDNLFYNTADAAANGEGIMRIYDKGAADEFRVNSPVGEYGILYAAGCSNTGTPATCPDGIDGRDDGSVNDPVVTNVAVVADASVANHVRVGLIYYQAGIAVLNLDAFRGVQGANATWNGGVLFAGNSAAGGPNANTFLTWNYLGGGEKNLQQVLTTYTVDDFARGLRERVHNIKFNNTTELNSTIYFCRANHNEFNYSSNPTYLNGSKIRVKENTTDSPVSYLTTVGLYSADNELLAVAKLSEPLKKDPTNELTLRVRLDY